MVWFDQTDSPPVCNHPAYSTPTITFDALMMAKALDPSLSPRLSDELLVMIDVISVPPGSSMVTSQFTAPVLMVLTVPFRMFFALIFMVCELF